MSRDTESFRCIVFVIWYDVSMNFRWHNDVRASDKTFGIIFIVVVCCHPLPRYTVHRKCYLTLCASIWNSGDLNNLQQYTFVPIPHIIYHYFFPMFSMFCFDFVSKVIPSRSISHLFFFQSCHTRRRVWSNWSLARIKRNLAKYEPLICWFNFNRLFKVLWLIDWLLLNEI